MCFYPRGFAMDHSPCCRLCGRKYPAKSMIAIFSQSGDRERLPTRIVDLARVPVRHGDGLPTTICQPCKRRLVTLEKAVVGLSEFRKQCQDTYQTMVLSSGTASIHSNETLQSESLKRPKESSSNIGVSPDTARCRISDRGLAGPVLRTLLKQPL